MNKRTPPPPCVTTKVAIWMSGPPTGSLQRNFPPPTKRSRLLRALTGTSLLELPFRAEDPATYPPPPFSLVLTYLHQGKFPHILIS